MANTIESTTDEALLRSIIDGSVEEFEDDLVVSIPSTNARVHAGTFYKCQNLKRIYMKNLQVIPASFCNNCESLSKVILPNVTSVVNLSDVSVFANCYALSTLHLPKAESVAGLCNVDTLSSISNMESAPLTIVLPSVRNIGYNQHTFLRLNNIVAIDLGEDFERFSTATNYSVFYWNDNVKKTLKNFIIRAKSVPTISSSLGITASNATALEGIYVPSALISAYEADTKWSVMTGKFLPIEGSKYEHYYADGTPIGIAGIDSMVAYYDVGNADDWDSETKFISSHIENDFSAWNRSNTSSRPTDGNNNPPTIFYNGLASNYGAIQIYFGKPLNEISNIITLQYIYAENYSNFTFGCAAGIKNSINASVGNTWSQGYTSGINNTNSRVFHLLTIELDKNGIHKAYVDNELVKTDIAKNNTLSVTAIGIGAQNSYLGHVAIYDRALTEDEINQNCEYYKKYAMVGQTAFDSSGNFLGGWVSGKPYEIEWSEGGYQIDSSTGEVVTSSNAGDRVSNLLPCHGVSAVTISNIWSGNIYYYDNQGTFLRVFQKSGTEDAIADPFPCPVPINAYYLRVRKRNADSTVIPYAYDKLTSTSDSYKLNEHYVLEFDTASEPITIQSSHVYCYGATKLQTSMVARSWVYFYDENDTEISNVLRQNTATEIEIPEGTYYVAVYPNSSNPNPWIMFTA